MHGSALPPVPSFPSRFSPPPAVAAASVRVKIESPGASDGRAGPFAGQGALFGGVEGVGGGKGARSGVASEDGGTEVGSGRPDRRRPDKTAAPVVPSIETEVSDSLELLQLC